MRRHGTLTFALVVVALTALAAAHGPRQPGPKTTVAAAALQPAGVAGPLARR